MKWLKKIFNQEAKQVTVSGFISDIEAKLEQFRLNDKTVNKMADRVKELDATIKSFKEKIEESSREHERMDDLAQKIIEVVSHIYSMDTRLAQLEKRIEQIQKEVGLEEHGPEGELKKKPSEKQATFEL
jgi:DNA repair ATPase RecN